MRIIFGRHRGTKPIVLEGTPIYEGYAYFYESIDALKAMAEMG
jgi:hypothetical protein